MSDPYTYFSFFRGGLRLFDVSSVPSDRARFRDLDRVSSRALLDADSEGEWSESELVSEDEWSVSVVVSERSRDTRSSVSGFWFGLRFPGVFGEETCEVIPPLERRRAVVFLDLGL